MVLSLICGLFREYISTGQVGSISLEHLHMMHLLDIDYDLMELT